MGILGNAWTIIKSFFTGCEATALNLDEEFNQRWRFTTGELLPEDLINQNLESPNDYLKRFYYFSPYVNQVGPLLNRILYPLLKNPPNLFHS